jgi:hypothetical protein
VGREALCKYVLRPPIATERVDLLDNGLVRLALKRTHWGRLLSNQSGRPARRLVAA